MTRDLRIPPRADDHLISIAARGSRCTCGCGNAASRFVRCRRARCVIARCGVTRADMASVRDAHEIVCKAGAK